MEYSKKKKTEYSVYVKKCARDREEKSAQREERKKKNDDDDDNDCDGDEEEKKLPFFFINFGRRYLACDCIFWFLLFSVLCFDDY